MLENNQKPEDRNPENPFDGLSKPAQPGEALSQDKSPAEPLGERQVAPPQGRYQQFDNGAKLLVLQHNNPGLAVSISIDLRGLTYEGGAAHFVEHLMGVTIENLNKELFDASPIGKGLVTDQLILRFDAQIPYPDAGVPDPQTSEKLRLVVHCTTSPTFEEAAIEYDRGRILHEEGSRRNIWKLSDEVTKEGRGLVPSTPGSPTFIETVNESLLRATHAMLIDPARITVCLSLAESNDSEKNQALLQQQEQLCTPIVEWLQSLPQLPSTDKLPQPERKPLYPIERFLGFSHVPGPQVTYPVKEVHNMAISWHLNMKELIGAEALRDKDHGASMMGYARALVHVLNAKIWSYQESLKTTKESVFYSVPVSCDIDSEGINVSFDFRPFNKERQKAQKWLRGLMESLRNETPESLSTLLKNARLGWLPNEQGAAAVTTAELSLLTQLFPVGEPIEACYLERCSYYNREREARKVTGKHLRMLLNGIVEEKAITVTPELFEEFGRRGTPDR